MASGIRTPWWRKLIPALPASSHSKPTALVYVRYVHTSNLRLRGGGIPADRRNGMKFASFVLAIIPVGLASGTSLVTNGTFDSNCANWTFANTDSLTCATRPVRRVRPAIAHLLPFSTTAPE